MADIFDTASDTEELFRNRELANVRSLAATPIVTTGYCLHCGEQVGDGMRWCNKGCADDWQKDRR